MMTKYNAAQQQQLVDDDAAVLMIIMVSYRLPDVRSFRFYTINNEHRQTIHAPPSSRAQLLETVVVSWRVTGLRAVSSLVSSVELVWFAWAQTDNSP